MLIGLLSLYVPELARLTITPSSFSHSHSTGLPLDNDLNTIRAAYHNLRLRAHRVLALLCVFDCLFCLIIWVIVGQVRGFPSRVQAHLNDICVPLLPRASTAAGRAAAFRRACCTTSSSNRSLMSSYGLLGRPYISRLQSPLPSSLCPLPPKVRRLPAGGGAGAGLLGGPPRHLALHLVHNRRHHGLHHGQDLLLRLFRQQPVRRDGQIQHAPCASFASPQTSPRHASDYLVFIAAFILPWAEAYVYLSRVAPLNRKIGAPDGFRHIVLP